MKIKILNGLKTICTAVCATTVLASCQDYSIDSQPAGDPKLECDALAQYDIQAAGAGDILFNVSANTPWKITVATDDEEQSWCVPSPGMSSASGLVSEITVSTTDNMKTTPRQATLTITADNVDETIKIKVVQAARSNLSVYGAALTETFDLMSAGPKTLSIRSNKDWEIVCLDSWVHFSSTEGSASGDVATIEVTVDDNAGGVKREAVFSVRTAADKIEGLTIKQLGATLEVTQAEAAKLQGLAAMPRMGETVEIAVAATMEWAAASDDEWLSSGLIVDGNTLKVSWDCNPTFEPRTGTITLSAVGNSNIAPVSIPVRQATCISYLTRLGADQTDITSLLDNNGYIYLDCDRDVSVMFGEYKYGKFTWEFDGLTKGGTANTLILELAAKGHVGAAGYPGANVNIFNTSTTGYQGGNVFRVAGSFGWIASNAAGTLVQAAVDKLVAGAGIRKIELTLSEAENGNLHFKLIVDNIEALDQDAGPAIDGWALADTIWWNMRFFSNNSGYSATLKSFKAENLTY